MRVCVYISSMPFVYTLHLCGMTVHDLPCLTTGNQDFPQIFREDPAPRCQFPHFQSRAPAPLVEAEDLSPEKPGTRGEGKMDDL